MSEKIVVEMFDRNALLDQGYTLTVENWFGSLRLAHFLLERSTLMQCTLRKSRGVPHELANFHLRPIDSEFARNRDVLIV